MATTTATESEARRTPPRRRRAVLVTGLVVTGIIAVLGVTLLGLRTARAGALPGTTVAGRDVSGLLRPPLVALLEDVGAQRASQPLTVRRSDEALSATGADIGYRLDTNATADLILARGRQANPVAALNDQLRAFWEPIEVDPVTEVDPARLDAFVQRAAAELAAAPVEGTLTFVPARGGQATVERDDPSPGAEIVAPDLREQVLAALREGDAGTIDAPARVVPSVTNPTGLDAVERQAQQVLSVPIRLQGEGAAVNFTPAQLAGLLQVRLDPAALDPLTLAFDPARVDRAISPQFRTRVRTPPVDADFQIRAGRITIVPSRDGFAFDPQVTADQLLAVGTGTAAAVQGLKVAPLERQVEPPTLTTEDASALGIRERVSTFKTEHPSGEPRVENIHRAADILDGTIVEPGETFSLNGALGPRTIDNGFVPAPAIQEGKFVEEVGGGTSQLATTIFNAIFYGGYDILEHQPHTYYISRYPEGRESTVNYPTVDVKFLNDSPDALVIKTGYTESSVTVNFYGRRWAQVAERSSGRFNLNGNGFDIRISRDLTYPGGRRTSEDFFTRYENETAAAEASLEAISG